MKLPKTYRGWKRMAQLRGWHIPNVDIFGSVMSINYWQQMYDYESGKSEGRPIRPHR